MIKIKGMLKSNLCFFTKDKLLLIIYLFSLLFSPPIIPKINFIIPLSFLSLIILIRKNKIKLLFNLIKNKIFTKGLIVYYTYIFLIMIINFILTGNIDLQQIVITFYRFSLIFPSLIICIAYLMTLISEKNITYRDFMICLLLAGSIQGIFSLASLFSPIIKNILVNIMYFGTGDKLLLNPWHLERRFFGFANNMYDGYGFGTGLLAALPFFCACYWSTKFLLFVPFLIFPALLNSRTGLLILVLGFIISIPLLFFINDKQKKRNILLLYTILLLLIGISVLFIFYFSKPTYDWIMSFLLVFRGGGIDPSLEVLFGNRFWTFPKGIQLIFGSGHSLYGAVGFVHSDIGLINDIWIGGIIGTFFLYITIILQFVKIYKRVYHFEIRMIIVFFFLAYFAYNIKSMAFTGNVGTIIVLLLLFIIDNYQTSFDNEKDNLNNYFEFDDKALDAFPLISIIIPIYDVERELKRCINSVIGQSYTNLEIILVDDGSPDNCPQICDEYAEKDKRIRVLHKKNEGVSAARNDGINIATGEYVAFIDSDDYVHKDYIKYLFNAICKYDADISVCSYYEVFSNQEIIFKKKNKQILVMDNLEAIKDIFTLPNYTTVVVWNKLYKTNLFRNNQITYPTNRRHEDDATTYKLYFYSNKIVFFDIPLYYYLQNTLGFMGQKFHRSRLDILIALKEIRAFISKYHLPLVNEMYCNELLRLLTLINNIVDTKAIAPNIWNKLRSMILERKTQYLRNPYITYKQKIALIALILGKPIYVFVRRVFTQYKLNL